MTLRHCQELFHDRCKIINHISITYTKILDFNPEAPSLTFLPAHEHSCHFRDLDRPMLLNLLLQKSLKFQLSLILDLALVAVAGQDIIQQRLRLIHQQIILIHPKFHLFKLFPQHSLSIFQAKQLVKSYL